MGRSEYSAPVTRGQSIGALLHQHTLGVVVSSPQQYNDLRGSWVLV